MYMVSQSYQLLVIDAQNNMNTKKNLHMKDENYYYSSL
jgi:CO dehydrogenase nickel-insertion accessory protein CooC1